VPVPEFSKAVATAWMLCFFNPPSQCLLDPQSRAPPSDLPPPPSFPLQAASFGKCLCEGFDAQRFVTACHTLRVLNAVRAAEVGMPLTLPQCAGVACLRGSRWLGRVWVSRGIRLPGCCCVSVTPAPPAPVCPWLPGSGSLIDRSPVHLSAIFVGLPLCVDVCDHDLGSPPLQV